jgi:hypothetical protein
MIQRNFEPYTIEVTRNLDLSGLSDSAADRLREESSSRGDDAILDRIFGRSSASAGRIVIIEWAKWLQFPQQLPPRMQREPGEPAQKSTEELTTRYRVEPS